MSNQLSHSTTLEEGAEKVRNFLHEVTAAMFALREEVTRTCTDAKEASARLQAASAC